MELSYEFAKILPDDDSTFIAYQKFKKQFGEDGSVMVIGFADKDLFKYEKFKDWYELSNNLKKIKGVKEVLSLPLVYNVYLDQWFHSNQSARTNQRMPRGF